MKKVWVIILAVSLAVFVVAGINVFRLGSEYRKGIQEYEKLENYAEVADDTAIETAEEETEAAEAEEEKVTIPVSLDVRFDELQSLNEDFVGWIYYAPLELSYPIVRGDDNDYYTHYTFEGEKNASGAIFMDFLNRKDFTDYNTIIYGHNMRNGTMFGSLKKLLNDESYLEEDQNFYIFTEDATYMYEIFAVYLTKADSNTYNLIRSEEEQQALLDYVAENATYLSDKEVTAQDQIVTLSTCHGLHSTNRTVVMGVLVASENRE